MKIWKNKELLQIGWTKMKENFWFLVLLLLLSIVLSTLGQETHAGFIVDILISFVLTSAFLRISRGQKVDFKNIFDEMSWMKLVHYLLASIIVGIFFVIGLVLFVIPGVIVGIMLSFVTNILVDENKGVAWKSMAFWTAIKKSVAMTKGIKWKLFVFFLVLLGINILGLLALGVGLFVTIPLSGIAMAVLYDKLKGRATETVVVAVSNNDVPPPSETIAA